jgi:hypothetical protein
MVPKPRRTSSLLFQKWFPNIWPQLEPNSMIVIDSAPYHSVKLDCPPSKMWWKQAITDWLHEINVSFNESAVKVELLTKVKSCANACNKHIIDDLANKACHVVARLLPYHCNLNLIDLV